MHSVLDTVFWLDSFYRKATRSDTLMIVEGSDDVCPRKITVYCVSTIQCVLLYMVGDMIQERYGLI